MPNSKSGTITTDIAKAVLEARAGRVEYRIDQAGIVHAGIGKVSFGADKLTNNVEAILASLRAAKPAGIKGSYIKSVYLATTMGPSIKINLNNS
jgi:large subunit ribosomal protein L1